MNPAVVDFGKFNEMTDGDAEFACELACSYIESGEQALSEVRQALENLDRAGLSRAAHKLKGASANIYAHAMRDAAGMLETQAALLDPAQLREMIRVLQIEFAAVSDSLHEYIPPPAAAVG